MIFRNLAAFTLVLRCVAPAAAQTPAHEFHVDFRPYSGMIGIAWRTAPYWSSGVAVGGGVDVLDRTVYPDPGSPAFHPLDQIVRLDTFLRHKPSARWDVDLGLRIGVGDVRSCDASDCWPGLMRGAFAAAFWGGTHWKIGSRVAYINVSENDRADGVLYLEIVTGRFSWAW